MPPQTPPQKIPLRVLMRTHFFTSVFPAINHWLEVNFVETGVEFSKIYIYVHIFVNNVYSEFVNIFNFVLRDSKISASFFRFQKMKQDTYNSLFKKFVFKEQN